MDALGEQLKFFGSQVRIADTPAVCPTPIHVQTQMMYNFVQLFATSLLVLNFSKIGASALRSASFILEYVY